MARSTEQIAAAVTRLQGQVPGFAKLKLVFGLELTGAGLTGPASSERYRIELPGPKVSEDAAEDGRVQLSLPKPMFGVLADEGQLADFKEAFYYGHLKVTGDERVKRLLGRAIDAA